MAAVIRSCRVAFSSCGAHDCKGEFVHNPQQRAQAKNLHPQKRSGAQIVPLEMTSTRESLGRSCIVCLFSGFLLLLGCLDKPCWLLSRAAEHAQLAYCHVVPVQQPEAINYEAYMTQRGLLQV